MGITVQVRSIIVPESQRRVHGPPNFSDSDYEFIREICLVFGWDKVPWDEPSDTIGTVDVSFSAKGFALLLDIAQDYLGVEGAKSLLGGNRFTSLYLPVNFFVPIQLENYAVGSFSIASSLGLLEDCQKLEEVVHGMIAVYGSDYSFKSSAYSLDDLHSILIYLIKACIESVDIRLPVLIRW